MSGISPGAVANHLGALRQAGAYNRDQKDRLMSGISGTLHAGGDIAREAKLKQQLAKALADAGLPADLIAGGPRAVAQAIQDQLHAKQQAARDATNRAADQEFSKGQQQRGFDNQRNLAEFDATATMDRDAAKAARDVEYQKMLGGQTASLAAPVTEYRPRDDLGFSPAVPSFDQMKPMDRAPSPMEVMGRAGKGGYMQDALTTALGALPRESKPRNIDPLSPEGIAAEEERRRRLGGLEPPPETPEQKEARLEREAAARARGTAAGTPKEPEKPKPWTPMTREEQVQFAKDIAEARRGPAATNPDVLKRLRLAITDPQDAARWDMMVREQGSGLGGDAEDWDELVSKMQQKYGGGAAGPVDDATRRAAIEEARKRGLLPK